MCPRTWSTVRPAAINSLVEPMSTPMKHGKRIGGLEIRMWISLAPAARNRSMILRDVVPRTMESSTAITRLPLIDRGRALSFDRRFLGQLVAHPDARLLQLAVLEDGVRPGEVDELEDAHRVLARGLERKVVDAVLVHHHHLA